MKKIRNTDSKDRIILKIENNVDHFFYRQYKSGKDQYLYSKKHSKTISGFFRKNGVKISSCSFSMTLGQIHSFKFNNDHDIKSFFNRIPIMIKFIKDCTDDTEANEVTTHTEEDTAEDETFDIYANLKIA